jgi:hypothetical protein
MHRAGWTAMHTTAMYLPDTMSDVEQKSFVDLIHSTLLYPGNVSQIAFRLFGYLVDTGIERYRYRYREPV